MDFKVAGTHKGITSIQMDLKIDGLTPEIIRQALAQTHAGRDYIIDNVILKAIAQPRPEVSRYAPKMTTMKIDPDKIREVIGKGGATIQKIVADTGAKIDIDDDGTIHIAAVNGDKISFQCVCGKEAVAKGLKAGDIIKNITAIAGGKGGGKPDSAMGGCKEILKLDDAMAAVDDFVNANAKD